MRKKDEDDEARKLAKAQAEEAGEAFDEDDGGGAVKNQFNYSQRACQTMTPSVRNRGVSTTPPSMVMFASATSQWEVRKRETADRRPSRAVTAVAVRARPSVCSVARPTAAAGERSDDDDDDGEARPRASRRLSLSPDLSPPPRSLALGRLGLRVVLRAVLELRS